MFFRELTARVPVKAAVMGRTAPWSAPASTSSTARPSTVSASAKRVLFFFHVLPPLSPPGGGLYNAITDQLQPIETWLLCSPSRLEGSEMLQPLLGGNLGPRVQRHLPLRQRGQMRPSGRILQLHRRLARQPLRAAMSGEYLHVIG